MKNILLIFHPRGGNVEKSANLIHQQFPQAVKFSLEGFDVEALKDAQLLIIGGSTVGASNWEEAAAINTWTVFFNDIRKKNISLAGKHIALFGLGGTRYYIQIISFMDCRSSKRNSRNSVRNSLDSGQPRGIPLHILKL